MSSRSFSGGAPKANGRRAWGCAVGRAAQVADGRSFALSPWPFILVGAREFVADERLCEPQRVRSAPQSNVAQEWARSVAAVTYVIAQPCIGVKDNSCVEVCPVDCIHSTDEADQYYINPDECIDCGVCAEVCPVEAIFFEDDLPEQWAEFKPKNAAFFAQ
jgi:NAD-dependent dihydropyrimidine dehydrogenase PreA subunit